MNQSFNKDIQDIKKGILKLHTISLGISMINAIYCIITIGILAITLFSGVFSAESGGASGWFLFVLPVFIIMYVLACVPDFICLVASFLYNEKPKTRYLILAIILSLIGCLIMNSQLIDELMYSVSHVYVYIYNIFKIVIIIFNVMLLIRSNKSS